MPKTKISEYSTNPANNTDIDGINTGEGMLPSDVNNAIRELMSQLKNQQAGLDGDNFTVGKNLAVTGTTTLATSTTGVLKAASGVVGIAVSGTDFKTVGGTSILGSGDISVGTGDVTLTGTQTLTNKTLTGMRETQVASSANNFNLLSGNYFTHTVSGATTFTVSNTASSGSVSAFVLDLANGGSATVTWWSGIKWADGTPPTLTASGNDLLAFFTYNGGTTWYGLVLSKAMA